MSMPKIRWRRCQLLTAVGIVMVISGIAGPAHAAVYTSAWWVRGSLNNKSVCGLAEVGNPFGIYSGKGTTKRTNQSYSCSGSDVAGEFLAVEVTFQQAYGFAWIDCGTASYSQNSANLFSIAHNDNGCSTSGTHYWRTLTLHGGYIDGNLYPPNHYPLYISPSTAF